MKPCSHHTTLPRHPDIRFKDMSERSVCLVHILWSLLLARLWYHCSQTVLTSLLLWHYKQLSSGLHTLPFTVLLSCSRVCPVLPSPIPTTLSTLHKCNIHFMVGHPRAHSSLTSTVLWTSSSQHCSMFSFGCFCLTSLPPLFIYAVCFRNSPSIHSAIFFHSTSMSS